MFNFDSHQRSQDPLLERAPPLQTTGLTAITGQASAPNNERPTTSSSFIVAADPFELNQSIWSSNPNSAHSSFSNQQQSSLPASAPAPATNTNINNTHGAPTQLNPTQGGFFQNVGSPTSQPQMFTSQAQHGLSAFLGTRRGSALEPYNIQQMQQAPPAQQQQQQQQQFQHFNNNNGNYTIWSQGMPNSIGGNNQSFDVQQDQLNQWQLQLQLQQQQQQQQQQQFQQQQQPTSSQGRNSAPDTAGFFNVSNRRHHSLDSGYDRAPTFNETVFADSSNPGAVLETTPSLIETYKSVDFYFTDDPYKRVTITAASMDSMSTLFEKVAKSGAQLPRFSSAQLPSAQMVLISFKSGRVDVFYLPESSNLTLKIGDLVVVEADRGKDMGKVLKLDVTIDDARLLKYLQHQEQQTALASFDAASPPASSGNHGTGNSQGNSQSSNTSSNQNMIPSLHFPKPILRFAMPNEVYQIVNKQADEDKAKKICSLKVDGSSLGMRVVDAEYQWDRRKLTFYYSASHRIDFRELVRELFRIYKTRIWMCAVASETEDDPAQQISVSNTMGMIPDEAVSPYYSHDDSNFLNTRLKSASSSPKSAPNSSGFQRDLSMHVPRQFSSPDKSLWN